MSKFKNGDRVRTVRQNMPLYDLGEIGRVLRHRKVDDMYLVHFDDKDGILRESWLCEGSIELLKAKHPVIVITTDGVTTTATKRLGKKVLGTAYSKCAPCDIFDSDFGAILALTRLCDIPVNFVTDETTKKPQKYTHKVVCVESVTKWWTVGKIYECKDGVLQDDSGLNRDRSICTFPKDIDELNSTWWDTPNGREARFIELVEG